MQKLELTVKQARALVSIAPKNDVRYYMNGIWADFTKCRFVATNGHMLLETPARGTPPDDCSGCTTIPRDALDSIAKGGKADDQIEIAYDAEQKQITLTRQTGMAMTVTELDGTYPNVDRVIPHQVSGETAQFNADYLATCQKALRLCADANNLNPYLAHNGASAAIMSSAECDSYAVIMPLRASEAADWIHFRENDRAVA